MLEVKNLTKTYKRHIVLDDVGFAASSGQCVGIAGHNGSGKSTLLSIIARTLRPDTGEVLVDGEPAVSSDLGYVPQANSLLEDLSVGETLSFWQRIYGLSPESLYAPSAPATMLGLEELRKKRVGRLSGGMRKRVSIAIALLHRPRLLLFDEALSALDRHYRIELEGYMSDFCRQGGCILYCSHDIRELTALCERIIVLRQGRKIFDDAKSAFPDEPSALDFLLNPDADMGM